MRQGAASLRVALRRAIAGLAFAGALGCAAPAPEPEPIGPGRETAELLGFEQTLQGELDCAAGACRRWYRIDQALAGELQVDVRAPSGEDVPDFDVRLEDAAGELLWGFAPTGISPRKLRRVLDPGTYYVSLFSIGDVRGPLAFEIAARLEPIEGPLPEPSELRRAGRRAVSARPPPEFWMSAEIVRVEGSAGLPSFVVIDAGSRDELRVGLRGELLERGAAIAALELVEVEPASSRARLLRPPSAAITFETRARIRVPLSAR